MLQLTFLKNSFNLKVAFLEDGGQSCDFGPHSEIGKVLQQIRQVKRRRCPS